MFKNKTVGYFIFCFLTATRMVGAAELPSKSQISSVYSEETCTPSERWSWPDNDSLKGSIWVQEFESSALRKSSKVRGFSEALALRKLAKSDRERAFSEYWMSRVLFSAGLVHLAEKGFSALLKSEVISDTAPFQLAALGCLSFIHRKYSGILIDANLIPRIIELNSAISNLSSNSKILKSSIWEAAMYLALDGSHNTPEILDLLNGSGAYENFSLAVLHISQSRYTEALKDLDSFFLNAKGNDLFKSFMDRAHLLYGRAAYALERYQDAVQHYQSIGMRSNERVHGLSELSWSFLMMQRYREAIGTAIGLQSGALKQTFAPEALMVMAMALNEMCRFPDAMSVIQSFRRNFKDSYFWLKNDSLSDPKLQVDHYHRAVDFAKGLASAQVPAPIASEWIRSSVFLANQEQINLIFKENGLANQLSQEGKNEQRLMLLKLLADVRKLNEKFKRVKINGRPNEKLSEDLISQMNILKQELIHFQHMKSAAPLWRKMLSAHMGRVLHIQRAAVAEINREINQLNQRMYAQLEEIAENNELIEVEIFNGASEDIIWQNAHPDFKEAAKKMKQTGSQAPAEKVWNWGKTQGGLDGRSEIWEDEIGSLAADIYDNCESKDKYLAVEKDASIQ